MDLILFFYMLPFYCVFFLASLSIMGQLVICTHLGLLFCSIDLYDVTVNLVFSNKMSA